LGVIAKVDGTSSGLLVVFIQFGVEKTSRLDMMSRKKLYLATGDKE